MSAYESRPVRRRRSADELAEVRAAIYSVALEQAPITARGIYYQLVSRGTIEKTEQAYKSTVRILGEMRREGELPFDWIADNTRWMRKPQTFTSIAAWADLSKEMYRRSLWAEQNAYVEVWLEKDALASVLHEVTREWDVPLMVTRGYPSLSYIYEAALQIRAVGKPVFLYYFGDHDPSGIDIPRAVEKGVRELAPDADVTFKRVAVTPEQIHYYSLPTRPTKKTDSRSKSFEGESVEVDAIPPRELRNLVSCCILQHLDQRTYQQTIEVEAEERKAIEMFAATVRGAA